MPVSLYVMRLGRLLNRRTLARRLVAEHGPRYDQQAAHERHDRDLASLLAAATGAREDGAEVRIACDRAPGVLCDFGHEGGRVQLRGQVMHQSGHRAAIDHDQPRAESLEQISQRTELLIPRSSARVVMPDLL